MAAGPIFKLGVICMKTLLERVRSNELNDDEATLLIMGFCKGRLSGAGCEGCPSRTELSQNGRCVFAGMSIEEAKAITGKILT